jgi:hypothetical protein
MPTKVDALLIEQHSSSEVEVGGGIPSSRRLLVWAQMDVWGTGDVSPTRQMAAWIALAITVAIMVLLALGY